MLPLKRTDLIIVLLSFRQTLLIQVPNHKDRTVTFNVSSDIDFISGPKQLIVGKCGSV